VEELGRYLIHKCEELNMKVTKYENTGNFAPSSWLGLTQTGVPVRISYRTGRIRVIKGEVPLPNSDSSEVVVEDTIETEGSNSRLSGHKMAEILEEYGISVSVGNEVTVKKDDDIDAIKEQISTYIEDIEVEN
jgi:hypothetical protein